MMAKKLVDTKIKIGENVLAETRVRLSPLNGFRVDEVEVIKRADIVYLSGIVRGDFPQNTYSLVSRLPVGYRPNNTTYGGCATVGGNVGIVEVPTSGDIRINQRTGRNDLTWMGFTLVFFV